MGIIIIIDIEFCDLAILGEVRALEREGKTNISSSTIEKPQILRGLGGDRRKEGAERPKE